MLRIVVQDNLMEDLFLASVVAVTRNGLGDFYLFDTFEQADCHPIVQYGDVICCGSEQILRKYNRLDLPDLLRRLGDEDLRSEVLSTLAKSGITTSFRETFTPIIWDRMCRVAARPTTVPEEILSIIVSDRKATINSSRKEHKMNDTATTTAAEGAGAAAPKEEKIRKIGKFTENQVITLLVDDKGVPYGKDNNPKKAGSKTASRFEVYKNGITVKDALAGGLHSADIQYDAEHNFIKVE